MIDTGADMAVEIAVRAFGQAERPVNIDPEPRLLVAGPLIR
jgi:hypothetical protein